MKNKEIILLIEELKQQVEECRDRDSSNYIDSLLKRTDWIINQSKVNNGVLDDVISYSYCDCDNECKNLDCSIIKCKQGNKR